MKIIDRGVLKKGAIYTLDEDHVRGLTTSVNNGQALLAMQYAVLVIADLQEEVVALRAQVEELASRPAPAAAKKAPEKKADVGPDA